MAIIDSILGQVEPKQSWIQELIANRQQPQNKRVVRKPVGFSFQRDPMDLSSFYNELNAVKNTAKLATQVTQQEVANRQAAEAKRQYEESQKAQREALAALNASNGPEDITSGSFTGKSRKYGLTRVSSNVAKAADYWGSKYGIENVGGYREHGSVPHSDHPKGLALDFMTYSNKYQGTQLANDIIKNYKAWNVKYVIWNRYIWHPDRGWRRYNGPSPHTDHVHVSFNK